MSELSRGRCQGLIAGLLLLLGCAAAWAWNAASSAPALSREQLRVLERYGFEPIEVVREIEVPVEIRVPVEVVVTERIEVEVPGREVEVIRTVEVPADCPDVGPVTLGGGCKLVVAGYGAERHVKGWFHAEAIGNGWSASDEHEIDPASVTYEAVADPAAKAWTRRVWAGGVIASDALGPIFSVSLERRKWVAKVGVGALIGVSEPTIGLLDGDYPVITSDSKTEPLFLFELGRAW